MKYNVEDFGGLCEILASITINGLQLGRHFYESRMRCKPSENIPIALYDLNKSGWDDVEKGY